MNDPTHHHLRGDLWAQSRHAQLVALLGQPRTAAETDLFVLLSRLLSDDETKILLEVVRRLVEEPSS